jgi:ABC-type Mn2+/Zn2+ transport system permease subunit
MLLCFDPSHAHVIALPTRLLHYLLLSLLALAIVVSLKAVGIILVIAMLVTPGAVAYLVSDSFERMLVIAAGTAVGSTVIGVYSSYFINGSTGACIVLVQAVIFLGAMIFAPKHGLWKRARGS